MKKAILVIICLLAVNMIFLSLRNAYADYSGFVDDMNNTDKQQARDNIRQGIEDGKVTEEDANRYAFTLNELIGIFDRLDLGLPIPPKPEKCEPLTPGQKEAAKKAKEAVAEAAGDAAKAVDKAIELIMAKKAEDGVSEQSINEYTRYIFQYVDLTYSAWHLPLVQAAGLQYARVETRDPVTGIVNWQGVLPNRAFSIAAAYTGAASMPIFFATVREQGANPDHVLEAGQKGVGVWSFAPLTIAIAETDTIAYEFNNGSVVAKDVYFKHTVDAGGFLVNTAVLGNNGTDNSGTFIQQNLGTVPPGFIAVNDNYIVEKEANLDEVGFIGMPPAIIFPGEVPTYPPGDPAETGK